MASWRVSTVLLLTVLSACAVEKYPVATGGSRADGTVKVSYDVGRFDKPQVHMDVAQSQAEHSCKTWGYKGAEPFGGSESQCHQFNGFGNCVQATVTLT
jgi:hypothetical protein